MIIVMHICSWTITVVALAAGIGNSIIEVLFKNCALFTDCISEVNNTQIDKAKDIDVVIPIYNLIEHSNNYSKTSGSLWQYCRDQPALTNAGALDNLPVNSAWFKFEQKIAGSAGDDGTKAIKIIVLLKYLSNFWRTLQMPLINCEINLILTCIISSATAGQQQHFQ